MNWRQREFLENQHRARIRVEQEEQRKQEKAERTEEREKSFDIVSDNLIRHKEAIYAISIVIFVILTLIFWISGKDDPNKPSIGIILLLGAAVGGGIAFGIIRTLTRIEIWRMIRHNYPFQLWQFPVGFGVISPGLYMMFKTEEYSSDDMHLTALYAVGIGLAISIFLFFKLTNEAVTVMAHMSMRASEAVEAIRLTNQKNS